MKFTSQLALLGLLLLAACSAATENADDQPTPANTAAISSQQPALEAIAYGRNDDGTYFYGAPDAPVTLTDYSDFL